MTIEILAIRVEAGVWWTIYRARGKRSGTLDEVGIWYEGWISGIASIAKSIADDRDEEIKRLIERIA